MQHFTCSGLDILPQLNMKTLNQRIEEPQSSPNRLLHYLVRFIPRHMRRAILWVSVLTAFDKSKTVDEKSVTALNDTLKLCQKRSAINLPLSLSHAIWRDIEGAMQVLRSNPKTADEKVICKNSFIRQIPEWLRYSSDNAIERDLANLLAHRHRFGI